MNLETSAAVVMLSYTIISYTLYAAAGRFRQTVLVAFSSAAVLLAYLSYSSRGVPGLTGFFSSITLIFMLVGSELEGAERRDLISLLGTYFVGTSIMLTSTTSAFRLFIYWEAIAVLMIGALGMFRREEGYAAALKYAVICLPGSVIGLMGLIMAAGESGTFLFPQLLSGSSLLSKALISIGFGAEAALFPMYVWLPSVYVGMPPLLLGIEVSSLLPASVYIVGTVASTSAPIAAAVSFLALAGSIIGSLSAIAQNDLRLLLSYSTLSHIGYMIMGLSVGTALARDYSLLHIVAHEIPKASLIAVAFVALSRLGGSKISDLGAMKGAYKFAAIGGALALLGLPPFLSFWSELFIFLGTFSSTLLWKAVALVYFTAILISSGYAFKIIYAYSAAPSKGREGRATDAFGILLLLFFALSLLLSPLQSYIVSYFLG